MFLGDREKSGIAYHCLLNMNFLNKQSQGSAVAVVMSVNYYFSSVAIGAPNPHIRGLSIPVKVNTKKQNKQGLVLEYSLLCK